MAMKSIPRAETRGPRGISVTGAAMVDDRLMFTLSDGTTVDAGVARGTQGLPGLEDVPTDPGIAALLAPDVTSDTKSALIKFMSFFTVNVKDHGATGNYVTDDTAAIMAALAVNGKAFVPAGVYNIDGTIILRTGQELVLAAGAALRRPPTSTSTSPLVWLSANDAVLRGAGKRASYVHSLTPSPLGVVLIGYYGAGDTAPRSAVYNNVKSLAVQGHAPGGGTTGEPSIGIYLCNPNLGGLASYFNTLNDLFVGYANVGILLHGQANANIISDIQFLEVGNEKRLDGAAIKLSPIGTSTPLDNTFSDVFHHKSSNAITLYFDGPVSYNNFTGIMAEQGGGSAKFIKNNNDLCGSNTIIGLDNTGGGSDLTPNFVKLNTYIRRGQVSARAMTTVALTAESVLATTLSTLHTTMGEFKISDLAENTKYNAFDVTVGNGSADFLVDLSVEIRASADVSAFRSVARATYEVSASGTTVTVTPLSSFAKRNTLLVPVVTGRVVTFGFATGNNGTAVQTSVATIQYHVSENDRVTVTAAAVAASASEVVPAHGGRVGSILLRDNAGAFEKSTNLGVSWSAV